MFFFDLFILFLRCLTPDEVMKQLRYRYDREIDRAERPILRKILEKDTPSTRRMVLCVSKIGKVGIQFAYLSFKTLKIQVN